MKNKVVRKSVDQTQRRRIIHQQQVAQAVASSGGNAVPANERVTSDGTARVTTDGTIRVTS